MLLLCCTGAAQVRLFLLLLTRVWTTEATRCKEADGDDTNKAGARSWSKHAQRRRFGAPLASPGRKTSASTERSLGEPPLGLHCTHAPARSPRRERTRSKRLLLIKLASGARPCPPQWTVLLCGYCCHLPLCWPVWYLTKHGQFEATSPFPSGEFIARQRVGRKRCGAGSSSRFSLRCKVGCCSTPLYS